MVWLKKARDELASEWLVLLNGIICLTAFIGAALNSHNVKYRSLLPLILRFATERIVHSQKSKDGFCQRRQELLLSGPDQC